MATQTEGQLALWLVGSPYTLHIPHPAFEDELNREFRNVGKNNTLHRAFEDEPDRGLQNVDKTQYSTSSL
jgi:hypothetical protein